MKEIYCIGFLWGLTVAVVSVEGASSSVSKAITLEESSMHKTPEIWDDSQNIGESNKADSASVSIAEIREAFQYKGEDPFKMKNFHGDQVRSNGSTAEEQDPFEKGFYGEQNSSVALAKSSDAFIPKNVLPKRTQDAMLAIKGENITVNTKIFSDAVCKDCLQLVEYLYLGTKRFDMYSRIYPGAFSKETEGERPPLYETLKRRGIEIFKPICGTNGKRDSAYIGLLAYRRTAGHLEIFVIWEGSQGEEFEFLGGLGGSSWRSNFLSNKVKVESQVLNLDASYGQLSFHEGYLSKITSAKIFIEEAIHELFAHLDVKDFCKFRALTSSEVTQRDVDNWRGYTVDVYIFGHSQGGGLTQVGAPYITEFIGQYLYGESFDNKTFNIAHAICMSPARAIGDEHTLRTVLDVMGQGNIFGYCSVIDVVPCLPLGDNIDKRPLLKIKAKIGLLILKAISWFLPKKWSEFVSAISETRFNYETLPIFAYVDHGALLERYCEKGKSVYSDLLNNAKKFKIRVNTKQLEKEKAKYEKIKNKIPEFRSLVKSMQEKYFNAHTSNPISSKYYAIATVDALRKILKIVPIGDLIASQHWGASVKVQKPAPNGSQEQQSSGASRIEQLFDHTLLSGEKIQDGINRGILYEKDKARAR